jgi:glycosyltransferase involved in cell wall biosynthesis
MALASAGTGVDVIGSERVDCAEMHTYPGLHFLNFQAGSNQRSGLAGKAIGFLAYYTRLVWYALAASPKVFHILWNGKFEYFDRTLLMLYYKLLGKKIALTAHNINAAKRDAKDSVLNRLSLRIQYRLVDQIFVHTEKMKQELSEEFGVREKAVTVVPFGINNAVPNTDLTTADAKRQLGLESGDRTILFFGKLRPSKGLHYLLAAFQLIAAKHVGYRLIIAGEPVKGSESYMRDIQEAVSRDSSRDRVLLRIGFIPDNETEIYFKAADVLALPYDDISQSGVLFLGYSFGLPVIASDVGSFSEDVVEEMTGYVCRPGDPVELARTIEKYFESGLFRSLDDRRREIREYAYRRHSWELIGEMTRNAYEQLLEGSRS